MTAENQLRDEIVSLGAALYDRGLTPGRTGNLSVRLGKHLLITPTNACLGRLEADRVSLVDGHGRHLSGDAPSKELPLHRVLYERHGGGRAVAHLHSTNAVALSCLEGLDPADVLPPITPYYLLRVGRLPLVAYHRPGSEQLERAVGIAALLSRSLLLANHGSVAVADSLSAALDAVEEIEETARLFLLLHDRPTRYLTEEAVLALVDNAAACGDLV